MKIRERVNDLYHRLIYREHDPVFRDLLQKRDPTDGEQAILCLAYADVGKISLYEKSLVEFGDKKLSQNVQDILLEAQLLSWLTTNKGSRQEMEKIATEVLSRNRDAVFAKSTLAQIEMLKNDFTTGIRIFEEILADHPRAIWVNKLIAQHLFLAHKYTEAELYIERLPDPATRTFYFWMSRLFVPHGPLVFGGIMLCLVLLPTNAAAWLFAVIAILSLSLHRYFRTKNETLVMRTVARLFFVSLLGTLANPLFRYLIVRGVSNS